MLIWLLSGVGVLGAFAFIVIRNAELDDKRRKMGKRPPLPNRWK